jgi:hypothetical protein
VVEGKRKGHCQAGLEPDSNPMSIRLPDHMYQQLEKSKSLSRVTMKMVLERTK